MLPLGVMLPPELEARLAALSRPEKAEIVARLAADLGGGWPGIECTPGVCGGDACVVRTRVPVWTLAAYRREGWSEARILEAFPALRAADLVHAWAYEAAHGDEVAQAIAANAAA